MVVACRAGKTDRSPHLRWAESPITNPLQPLIDLNKDKEAVGGRKMSTNYVCRNFLNTPSSVTFARSPENFCRFSFRTCLGIPHWKWGDFWWIFSGLRFPQNEARKLLKNFGENSEQNSGQNSVQKFEKFGELSFCNFSDLTALDFPAQFPGTKFVFPGFWRQGMNFRGRVQAFDPRPLEWKTPTSLRT